MQAAPQALSLRPSFVLTTGGRPHAPAGSCWHPMPWVVLTTGVKSHTQAGSCWRPCVPWRVPSKCWHLTVYLLGDVHLLPETRNHSSRK